MLPKPEYDNFYKFVVSIGILMVGLAFALPWFALKLSEPLATPERRRSDRVDARRNAIGDLALDAWPSLSADLFLGGLSAAHLVLVIAQPTRESDYSRREADARPRFDEALSVVDVPLTVTILREQVLDSLDPAEFRVLLPEELGLNPDGGPPR